MHDLRMEGIMLELKGIGFRVTDENTGKDKQILEDINLTIGSDKFVVITGPNGSGKSTLAKIIMGLEKPTSGSIVFDGVDITNMGIDERAKLGIGFAFQAPIKFKGLNVKDLLKIAHGGDMSRDEACVYLSEVGLCAADYIDRELNSSLSGGELKRIEIAMLLARKVKLSVFDEPEAGIDLWSFNNLINVFKQLREKTSGSIVIISHQERILNIADQIILIENGKVKKIGTHDEIYPTLLVCDDECECCVREVAL